MNNNEDNNAEHDHEKSLEDEKPEAKYPNAKTVISHCTLTAPDVTVIAKFDEAFADSFDTLLRVISENAKAVHANAEAVDGNAQALRQAVELLKGQGLELTTSPLILIDGDRAEKQPGVSQHDTGS
jgi:hypothetical protein